MKRVDGGMLGPDRSENYDNLLGRWQRPVGKPRAFGVDDAPLEASGEGVWGERTGDLYINDDVFFAHVPEAVWTYQLGGYPVLKKWLGYRQADRRDGSPLTDDERKSFGKSSSVSPRFWRCALNSTRSISWRWKMHLQRRTWGSTEKNLPKY